MRVQRLDARLLHPAQLDDGAVRRAGPGGGVRDAPVPGARSPGADGPRRARRRRRPADRPVVVGHRGDARQLDHRRRAVRTGRRASIRRWRCCRSATSTIEDVWHTDGMCATGSNDVVITDAFVPAHRLVRVTDIYKGTAPGAALHDADTYRWPMVPALALLAAMPALGSAERVADDLRRTTGRTRARLRGRHAEGQADRAGSPRRGAGAAARAARAARRHRRPASKPSSPQAIPCRDRCAAEARLAAAHIVHESRAVIADLLEASGASAHFLDNPLQRIKRDVDVICRPRGVRLRHQPRTRRARSHWV